MIIFDGVAFAKNKLDKLKLRISKLSAGQTKPKLMAILFSEDAGSLLYTKKKQQAAAYIGLDYQVKQFSITQDIKEIKASIEKFNQDQQITGIIIQKPWRKTYLGAVEASKEDYTNWWQQLVEFIHPSKDVDGLHPASLAAIKNNSWKEKGVVLPATCQAVWDILPQIPVWQQKKKGDKIIILGRSHLLGLPLYYLCLNQDLNVDILGKKQLDQRVNSGLSLQDAVIIVSATGQKNLISVEMVQQGAAILDAGEPNPDLNYQQIETKASFITPVPGGIGPVTVACLMENALKLVKI